MIRYPNLPPHNALVLLIGEKLVRGFDAQSIIMMLPLGSLIDDEFP